MPIQSQPTMFMSRIRLFGRGTPLIHIPQTASRAVPLDVVVNPVARPIVNIEGLMVMAPRTQKSQVLRRSLVTPSKPTKVKRTIFKKHRS